MIIPEDKVDRDQLYQDLARQCLASRADRFAFYQQLRNYYLFGTADASGAIYNKIASTIETLWSFIYAPDATRFSIHLGAAAPPSEIHKVRPLIHEINDQWRMGRSHLNFGLAGKWSLVFGSMLLKGLWRRNVFRSYIVEPHNFGVLREDIPDLEDQEAFVHCYTTTRTQLASDLEGNTRKEEIMGRVGKGVGENDVRYEAGMQRLILSAGISLTSPAPNTSGGAVAGGLTGSTRISYDYQPHVEADLLDMFELYVWNDKINDYQMVTIANPDVIVYDRKQPGVSGVGPFVKVAPEHNLHDYFWGESFVAKLAGLQDWRTKRVDEIRTILAKQADPPLGFSGFAGIAEEKMTAMRSAGGLISSAMPGAKIDNLAPQMPENIFKELNEIDREFDDQAGIGHILQGKGEPGVRSRGQADLMARLGSARPKSRAIVVEESAEDLATLMLRTIQENSKQRFEAKDEKNSDGTPLIFTAAQFTTDFEVRVDAHSSSPIFVEDRKADARDLMEARAITRERFIEMVDPPGKQLMLEELKGIEKREAEAAQREALAAQSGGAKQ